MLKAFVVTVYNSLEVAGETDNTFSTWSQPFFRMTHLKAIPNSAAPFDFRTR